MLLFIIVASFVLGLAIGLQNLKQFAVLSGVILFLIEPIAFLTTLLCALGIYWGYRHFQSKRKPRYVSKRHY